jgi:hypothetical protein
MTTPESPSALLERAAALIEQRAAAIPAFGGMHGIEGNEAWTAWLTMFMDPEPAVVASPLVEWLRETVEMYREEHARRTVSAEALDEAWSRHPAVAFARTVLGGS